MSDDERVMSAIGGPRAGRPIYATRMNDRRPWTMTSTWTSSITNFLSSYISLPSRSASRHAFIGLLIGFSLSLSSTSLVQYYQKRKKERQIAHFAPRPIELRSDEIVKGVSGLIGVPG